MPIFAFEDRMPDFGAVNTGKMTPKIGLAFGLNDPLNKNFFQIAALQQINKFGENSQSDLFASLENRSFPITLNLALIRINTPSKDTVRSDDPSQPLGISEYASEFYNAMLSATYSIFKKKDTLTVFGSYDWQNFNLYEDHFKWTSHKRLQTGLIAGISIADSLLNLQSLYSFSNSDLFRPGTFAESFYIENNVIKPIYRNFYLHEWAGVANISFNNPVQKNGKFSFSLFGSGILDWHSPDSDTLDNFYLHPLVMGGYPILENSESYFAQGRHTVLAEARYIFPIYSDLRKRFGIFTTRNFSVSPYAQMGTVLGDDRLRSLGIDWRLENRLFYLAPFNFNFGVAKGLDRPKDTRINVRVGN